jgi:TonB-linked SusC/RagA family outer membrane protein
MNLLRRNKPKGLWLSSKTKQVMKFTTILLVALTFQVSASVSSQSITFRGKNVTVKKVLSAIKKQSDYVFFYDANVISGIESISVDLKNVVIEKALSVVFANKSLTWIIEGKTISIFPKEQVVKDAPKIAIQQNELKGTVRGELGPLSGASVLVKGTNNAANTNDKGEFTLTNVSDDAVLIVTYLGYQKQQVPVKGKSNIDIKLVVEKNDLDEVKVVAYGTSTKRLSSASSTTIKGAELKNIPTANFASLLQGRVAGLDVSSFSGAPGGGGVTTTLRGYGGLSNGRVEGRDFSGPLWVIDGIPLQNTQSSITGTSALAEINPANIESIEVLKDASATVLYGSRAANGVIMVTTKKGKSGQSKISASVSLSYTYLTEFPTITAGVDARRHKILGLNNQQQAASGFNPATSTFEYVYPKSYQDAYNLTTNGYSGGIYGNWWQDGNAGNVPEVKRELQDSLNTFHNNSTNWFKLFYNVGKVVDANVQASGGSANFVYNFGVGIYDETGIVRNSGFSRVTILSNMSFNPSKRVTMNYRTYLAYSTRKRASAASSFSDPNALEDLPNLPFVSSPFLPGKGSIVEQSILSTLDGVKEKNENILLRSNLSLVYKLTDNLSFTTNNAFDYSQQESNRFVPSYLQRTGSETDNLALSSNNKGNTIILLTENTLNYKKQFGNHLVDVLAGINYEHDESTSTSGYGYGSPNNNIRYVLTGFPYYIVKQDQIIQTKDFKSNFEESNLLSYLARLNYSYDQKYNFSASVRRDGSSKFGKAIPYANFPALSGSWNFSEESFMNWIPELDFGKLRASWGISGRQFDSAYLAYGSIVPGPIFNGNTTYNVQSILNKDLSWEETRQTDLGFDLDFFNYRLSLVFDYYNRYTDKLLYEVALPSNTTLLPSQWRNAGAISNEGYEIGLKASIIQSQDFTWKLSFNIARNWNSFRKSFDNRDIGKFFTLGKPVNGIYVIPTNGIITDPNSIPSKYTANGQLLLLSLNGNASNSYQVGDVNALDSDGDGKIDVFRDVVYVGSPLPKVQGGFVNDFQWKNFDLSVVCPFSLGRTILNGTAGETLGVTAENLDKPILANLSNYTFWSANNPNAITDFPVLALDSKGNYSPLLDTNLQKNVNYIKIKTIVLGYNLDKAVVRKLKISDARFYITGENLFTLTNYIGRDPETVDIRSGIDRQTTYPLARKFTLGLNLNF